MTTLRDAIAAPRFSRFNVGLEELADLLADVANGFPALRAT